MDYYLSKWYSLELLESQINSVEQEKEFFYVAIHSTLVAGYCNIAPRENGMELSRLYLLPEYIGKEIGKKLLKLGEDFLGSKGINKYYCFVNRGNDLGMRFYRRNGFKNVPGKDLNNLEKHECHFYMEKQI